MMLGIFSADTAFIHLVAEISTMGTRVKCVLFVYVKHTVYSLLDKFPLPSVYLLFLMVL